MQHLVIGTQVFSVSARTPIEKMTRLSKGRFKEIELISHSTIYKSAAPLEEMTISCQWVNPQAEQHINTLRLMLDTPQQVSDGAGNNLGRWTIKAIQSEYTELTTHGHAQVTQLQITLLEAPHDRT